MMAGESPDPPAIRQVEPSQHKNKERVHELENMPSSVEPAAEAVIQLLSPLARETHTITTEESNHSYLIPQVAPQMSDFKVNGKSLRTDRFDMKLKAESASRAKPMVLIPAAAVSGTHVHI